MSDAHTQSHDALFGELRSLLMDGAPDWAPVLALLARFDPGRCEEEVLPYVEHHTAAWTSPVFWQRAWTDRLALGEAVPEQRLTTDLVWDQTLTTERWALLCDQELPRLRRLTLDGEGTSGFKDEHLTTACDAPWMPQLETLRLTRSGISEASGVRLASVPFVRLRDLSMGWTNCDDETLTALAGAPWMIHMRCLEYEGNSVHPDGANALFSSPHARFIEELRIGWNYLYDQSVETLARSPMLEHIRVLGLENDELTDRSVSLLLESARLTSLEDLDLHNNRITDASARALVQGADRLPQLTKLSLTSCDLGASGDALLHAAAHPALRAFRG